MDLASRHVTEIPLSYITSIPQIKCPIDNDIFSQKNVFRFMLGTIENNDMAFGTRFFIYSSGKAEKIQKTICAYNPNVKYSYKELPNIEK